jgi:predicted O-linked N-acetylglucosamine transferase (SPINDLY family)
VASLVPIPSFPQRDIVMNNPAQSLDLAVRCHQTGDLQQAEQLYRQILQVDPSNVNALHLLGLIALQAGKPDHAVDYISQALRLMPNFAEAHYNLGMALRQQGKLEEAVAHWRQALNNKPDYAEAHYHMGNALQQQGKLTDAMASWQQAVRLNPGYAEAHNNLGIGFQQQGKLQEAVASLQRALQLKPDFIQAHHNLGNALLAQGKLEEAIARYQHVLRFNPNSVAAYNNLGKALLDQGRLEEAVASLQRVMMIDPDFADAHNNLGLVRIEQGLLDDAIACFRRALQIKPDSVDAYNHLGNAFKKQGNLDQAMAYYRQALRLAPNFADARLNLGTAFQARGDYEAALECCRQAVRLQPNASGGHNNLGIVLAAMGKPEEALACYRQALQLSPNYAEAHFNLGVVLWEQGDMEAAIASFQHALEFKPNDVAALGALVHVLQHTCRWENLKQLSQKIIEFNDARADAGNASLITPFSFLTLPIATTAAQQLRCARNWVAQQPQLTLDRGPTPILNRSVDITSKITVGYLSADFHSHPTAFLTAELFEQHDRARFAVFGYSYGPDDGSPMRRRLGNAFDCFVDLRDVSYLDAARRIAADGVDILVDLKGHTRDGRPQILGARPAPIQVNYLAYPGTMGAPYIDYVLVDDFIVPPDQQPFFTEQLVHLPLCYQVNDSRREIAPTTPSRAECGLPEEGFVFCCFNNSYKITPEVFDVWMALLKALPGSVIWLLIGNDFAPANLRREAVARGVAEDRLVFAPWQPLPDHLARHRVADLFLDCFPVNAHTTASDALWAGCPVLTLAGKTFASRVAGSLLRTVGLPELITTSLEEYQAVALRVARDPDLLAHVRSKLAESRKTSPLFDATQFARHLERAYITMREINASGQRPRPFAVSPA